MSECRVPISIVDQQVRIPLEPARLRSLTEHVLRSEGRTGEGLELVFVDDVTISELHQRFMGDPTPTDVITFPSGDEPRSSEDGGPSALGEIVVSTDTAARQATEHGTSVEYETLLYVTHGILHLLGYDDLEEADSEIMARRQIEILEAWWRSNGHG